MKRVVVIQMSKKEFIRGEIVKSFWKSTEQEVSDIDLINQLSRKELTEEDVYTFSVVMADTNIDRDLERFTKSTLEELAELFKGKPLILDHTAKTINQKGRIFNTYVAPLDTDEEIASFGLIGNVYLLRNKENENLIENIEAGILKEVSVGCSVSEHLCSICEKDYWTDGNCNHYKGMKYSGKTCTVTLHGATDAYELSLVAIPAQRNAGIIKQYEKKKEKQGKEVEKMEKDKQVEQVDIPNVSFEEQIQKKFGKEITEVENIIKSFDEVKEKANKYDEIKENVIKGALANGVRAKGEDFDNELWEKTLKLFSLAEIQKHSKEWEEEAKTELKAGVKVSKQVETEKTEEINIDELIF